ncbi:membrane protein containing DUF1295 [Trypanosoma theileri]|uniref:Membrane protein containing DUF1295 n=1 Tax=Trypanosoma theileri TaxID=67003 RepID=A0A1X0P416_9TRYP|nr:membrane protein containing DUF1295 [Trypanosoma theileri]ORC91677.1 membrane protein containing DUF1295 [Trypanosoma theileri]
MLVLQWLEWDVLSSSSYNLTLAIMLVVSVFMYIASSINRNYSWVDRSWSILPVLYTWIHIYYNVKDTFHFTKTTSISTVLKNANIFYGIIITAWGIRLTFNFARRGGYSRGGEDYRWNYVRTWRLFSNPIIWELFSFWIIALFQTALLWAIALPMISIRSVPIKGEDIIIGSCMILFLLLETICDEQQQRFQRAKRKVKFQGNPRKLEGQAALLSYGFCITGVFGYSRHLNVFSEECFWLFLTMAGVAHGQIRWWQCTGCVALLLLTFFSTAYVNETISRQKYPLYAIYQETTPMLFPSLKVTTARTIYMIQKYCGKSR